MAIADFSYLLSAPFVFATLLHGISDVGFLGTALVTILVIASFQSVYLRKVEIRLRGCEREKKSLKKQLSELTVRKESRDCELVHEYELLREEWKQLNERIAEEGMQFEEGNAALEDEVSPKQKQLPLLKESSNIKAREFKETKGVVGVEVGSYFMVEDTRKAEASKTNGEVTAESSSEEDSDEEDYADSSDDEKFAVNAGKAKAATDTNDEISSDESSAVSSDDGSESDHKAEAEDDDGDSESHESEVSVEGAQPSEPCSQFTSLFRTHPYSDRFLQDEKAIARLLNKYYAAKDSIRASGPSTSAEQEEAQQNTAPVSLELQKEKKRCIEALRNAHMEQTLLGVLTTAAEQDRNQQFEDQVEILERALKKTVTELDNRRENLCEVLRAALYEGRKLGNVANALEAYLRATSEYNFVLTFKNLYSEPQHEKALRNLRSARERLDASFNDLSGDSVLRLFDETDVTWLPRTGAGIVAWIREANDRAERWSGSQVESKMLQIIRLLPVARPTSCEVADPIHEEHGHALQNIEDGIDDMRNVNDGEGDISADQTRDDIAVDVHDGNPVEVKQESAKTRKQREKRQAKRRAAREAKAETERLHLQTLS
ncbi:hypothetical protein M409DRAFT_24937 [Zasmidium cellare ATCC 36951]|uniref:Uncharacterized protein n=1 Tax=Zasmidium cellare ATCC 36951 TaxID=1080233 RepID=A0A6A6CGI6_ZASCE|nr:uncharacterized protein M409DRAFT_24937 [Zasmidium cellare ATCC 36951]KAF2164536.1 hypothetical protein M409DRAFT_24937 [Zasmidium cellare ATCC 36951]